MDESDSPQGSVANRKRLITPEFKFRYTVAEIRSTYSSLEDAFEQGDYLLCAEFAEANGELQGCGLVLGGAVDRGMKVLGDLNDLLSDRGVLCKAFGEWSRGSDVEACGTLERISRESIWAEKASALRDLIKRTSLTVFVTAAFLPRPAISGAPQNVPDPVHRIGRFVLKYVGTQLENNAYAYSPTDDFATFVESLPSSERPDIIFAMTPMWIVPRNLDQTAIPRVAWCHDTDMLLHRAVANLAAYDTLIVTTSQEHFELHRATGRFCVSNLVSDPLNAQFPPLKSTGLKDFDVIFTGSALDAFHSEKSRFLFQLSELGTDYKVVVVDGYVPQDEYFSLLSRSKFLPIINRYAGCPSPRWRDALANSTYVLYPDGTAYGNAFGGCFPIRMHSICEDVRFHLERYASGATPYDIDRNVAQIGQDFSAFREGWNNLHERQLKLVAFCALVMRPARAPARQHTKPRFTWPTPAVDQNIYGYHTIQRKVSGFARAIAENGVSNEEGFVDVAQLYARLAIAFGIAPEIPEWRARADTFFTEGCRRFPQSLALHFNHAHWIFFKGKTSRDRAAQLFETMLARWDSFRFDPLDAEFGSPYAIGDADLIFPYFEYAQLTTCYAVEAQDIGATRKQALFEKARDLLKGAVYGYLGWSNIEAGRDDKGIELLQTGLRLYPDNLPLAKFLLDVLLSSTQTGLTSARANAIADIFVICANLFPGILLTHTYQVLRAFTKAEREHQMSEIIEAWYRFGNIIRVTAHPHQRDLGRFIAVHEYAAHFPPRLVERLAAAAREGADLTQFEQFILEGGKAYRRLKRPFWRGGPIALRRLFPGEVSRAKVHSRTPLRYLLLESVRHFSCYRAFYDAYICARLGEPFSTIIEPSLFQRAIFHLTSAIRGTTASSHKRSPHPK